MNTFIDKIVDAIVTILAGKDKINSSLADYLKKGNNKLFILSFLFFIPFLLISNFLINSYDSIWLSLIPILLYVGVLFFVVITVSVENKLLLEKSKTRKDLTGFNLDLNRKALKKLFAYLTKYEFVDEELTNYQDFYDVMTLDFIEHDSIVHFKMNLAELKYLLEKIKKLGLGLTLTSFEKSKKIYNKGKLIKQKGLTSAYSDSLPDKEFRDHLDNFFESFPDI